MPINLSLKCEVCENTDMHWLEETVVDENFYQRFLKCNYCGAVNLVIYDNPRVVGHYIPK